MTKRQDKMVQAVPAIMAKKPSNGTLCQLSAVTAIGDTQDNAIGMHAVF